MKKLYLFILADVIWFIAYLFTSFYIIFENLRSFNLTGDGRIGALFQFFLFVIINVVFVFPQIILTFTIPSHQGATKRRLNRKSVLFCCHTFVLFLFNIYTQIVRFNNNDPEALSWLYVFVGFVLGSALIYYLYMRLLGKIFK